VRHPTYVSVTVLILIFLLSFWIIALPILAIVIPVALLSDIKKLWQYIKHKREIKNML